MNAEIIWNFLLCANACLDDDPNYLKAMCLIYTMSHLPYPTGSISNMLDSAIIHRHQSYKCAVMVSKKVVLPILG